MPPPPDPTTQSPETTTGDPGESNSFIPGSDVGYIECDVWLEDCPRGEKCMPWAIDGGQAWNALRCTPVDSNPRQVGESCTVEGNAFSGIDDCDIHSMCWSVDPETNMGTCVGFCTGSPRVPECPADYECAVTSSEILILCLPYCDPIVQGCPDGDACYPLDFGFGCAPVGAEAGEPGQSCETVDGCVLGSHCAAADSIPGCDGIGCCSPYCDFEEEGADAMCDAAIPGTTCVPWFDPGEQPPGYGSLGACIAG